MSMPPTCNVDIQFIDKESSVKMLSFLALTLAAQAHAAVVAPRATSAPVGSSYPITPITPKPTYTYPSVTDPGAPVVTALAGKTTYGSPDVNPASVLYGRYKSVLLLSFDGFHEYDLEYHMKNDPNSNIAKIATAGMQYTNAKTSSPSDSFPGVQAYLTGASSRTHGVYYDVSYDRSYWAPGSNCTGPQGTVCAFDESIDANSTDVTGGGYIDEANLPRTKTSWGTCVPVYPWNFVRVNNMFEVARGAGLETAYSDKHAAYVISNGPSGFGLSEGYFPEIGAYSTQMQFESYDDLHWNALTQWTKGNHFNGTKWTGTPPAIYGANFQTYSVAEKGAGYNADLSPSANLKQAFQYLDGKLGDLIQAMKDAGTYESTMLILTAKHGQSPIDRSKLVWVSPDALVNATGVDVPGLSADDGALLWLADSTKTPLAKANLMANAAALGIENVWIWPETMANGFGDPRIDSRAPYVVVKTKVGVIYSSGSAQKMAEHGGLNPDDTNVLLVASNPQCITAAKNNLRVSTRSIAATALKALGLDPLHLAVPVIDDWNADTEFNDALRKHGIIPEKESSRSPSPPPLPRSPSPTLSDIDLDDDLDDMVSRDVVERYRAERMKEQKVAEGNRRHGVIRPIGKKDFVREVTEGSKDDLEGETEGSGTGVVVYLFKDYLPECKHLLPLLTQLAALYPSTKFVSIVSDHCIENYPDKNCPTLLCYRAGEMMGQVVGLGGMGGMKGKLEDVERILFAFRALDLHLKVSSSTSAGFSSKKQQKDSDEDSEDDQTFVGGGKKSGIRSSRRQDDSDDEFDL